MTEETTCRGFEPEPNGCEEPTRTMPKRSNGYSNPRGLTEEDLDRLKAMLMEGLSYAEIAPAFNRSRGAIAGLVSRYCKGHARPKPSKNAQKSNPGHNNFRGKNGRKAPKVNKHAPALRVVPKAPDSNPCSIMELDSHRCRWITGEPTEPFDKIYCGGKADEGSSYCEFHRHVSKQKATGRTPEELQATRQKRGRLTANGFRDDYTIGVFS